jgi:hypothetical protein
MDFEDSAEEAAFRARVRAWLEANAPKFEWRGPPAFTPESLAIARAW